MKRITALFTGLMLMAALVINASFQASDSQVELVRLDGTSSGEFMPLGKEVDAIYGDLVLRNEHLTAVIAQPLESRHANMTVREVGGCLIDLAVRWNQSDQLSAFYPGARKFPYRGMSVRVDGKPVELTASKVEKAGDIEVIMKAAGDAKRPAVDVTYHLGAKSRVLDISSRFTNESSEPMEVTLEDDMRVDALKDDIVKAPNGTMDLFWVHDRFWGQAYGFEAEGHQIAANSSGGRTSTLRYESAAGRTIKLEPGKSFTLKRRVTPGTDLPMVRAIAAAGQKTPLHDVEFTVFDGLQRPIRDARVTLLRGDEEWGSMSTGGDGTARAALPKGGYTVKLTAIGVDITPSPAPVINATGKGMQKSVLVCDAWKPGTVEAVVTDGSGQPVPCKIEFFAREGTSPPNFGPDTADFAVRSLRYAPLGTFTQTLPPGQYEALISHGPEFDAVTQDVTVPPGKTIELKAQLKRVVDTSGWVSADFHSHSSPSGDNTSSQLGRVLGLLCDHVEFAPCTEHNRIDTYAPHIERLGISRFIASCSGMELTGSPLPLNHQNAFPLIHRPGQQDGGGPVTDVDIEKQVERLSLWDDRSEKLLQINHPDMGWLFRDRDGDGKPDEGYSRILPHIDVVEIHPVPDILKLEPVTKSTSTPMHSRVFNWMQFLNQGQRFVGVVNTDAHYNYHESGFIRNWIRSVTDEPSEIKPLDIVRAAEAGAVMMSNGPFLEVKVSEAGRSALAIAGQDLEAKSKKIVIDVRVQCPNWLDVDRVFVVVNGRIHEPHHYRRETHPDRFRSGVVRFAEKLELTLDRDAAILVACGAEKATIGRVQGPTWGKHNPAAFINPVIVDVDGNGFEPNKDTLGSPLPVKYQAAK